jgi:N-acetylmuramoyl-L-alanine amidase
MASAERALVALAAYRPLPNVLAEIERNEAEQSAESLRGRGVAPGVADAGARAASAPARDIVVPRGAANGSERAEITRVERYGAEDAARVVVFVTRPTRFEIGEVHSDADRPRLFVDIDDAVFAGKASYEVGGLVQRVRLGTESKTTRVVLDLSATVQSKVFYLPEPFRLVIDVSKESPHAIASARGARSVRRVVLDPGHGGNDPGATGPSGLREKDVVLDIAHRAAPLIARELGIATLLTRDRDDYVPLDERAARANAFHADLFVSIHCNASEDPVAKGVMTFVLDQGREDVAERVAARENAASSEAAAELSNAVSRITDRASREASLYFAELLQRSTAASLAPHYPEVPNAGVKRAGFYVLAGARMPAVLYEASFISTSAGEARLNTDDFRQKLADAIVNAVRAYRDGL